MMSVNELIKTVRINPVEVEGYVVYLNRRVLYLIDLDYGDNYLKAPAILIENDELSNILENNVSLYGGGNSGLFHHAKITGCVKDNLIHKCLSLYVEKVLVEDGKKWITIDLENKYDERDRYDRIDWFDVFK
ncbi:hypothetical protein C9426_22390 [Serratia sp. S1B]|nr:hypothetical protein C9426_22390 [Serratia sp. S1B]